MSVCVISCGVQGTAFNLQTKHSKNQLNITHQALGLRSLSLTMLSLHITSLPRRKILIRRCPLFIVLKMHAWSSSARLKHSGHGQ